MCLIYRYPVRFCSAAKISFFSKGGGGGLAYKWDLLFDLLLLFLKNALLSLLFHSKMSFTCKNPEFFPRSLRSLGFNRFNYYNDFFSGSTLQNIYFFLVLTPKGSLFSLYYFHCYYPAYLVWNLFLTTHCDKFCTWKSPAIPTFYTNNPYFFNTFPKFLSLLFPTFLLKGT